MKRCLSAKLRIKQSGACKAEMKITKTPQGQMIKQPILEIPVAILNSIRILEADDMRTTQNYNEFEKYKNRIKFLKICVGNYF